MSEARRIAEADRYRHSSRHGRHERKIVRQLEQIGNCGGESNIAIKRNSVFSTVAHLCTPVAGSEPAGCAACGRGGLSAREHRGAFYHRRLHVPRQPVAKRKINSNTTAPMKALIINATMPAPK